MGAVGIKIRSDLRHRRLQALVIGLIVFLASGAATLALDTLVEAQAPFEHAFAAANGAQLVIDYDGHLSATQLAATASAPPVTDSAGPWPVGPVGLSVPGDAAKGGGAFGGAFLDLAEVGGRADPATTVDRVTLAAGRWWVGPGEIVLAQAEAARAGKAVGDTILLQAVPPDLKGASAGPAVTSPQPQPTRTFSIVGIANSVSTPGIHAWMSPADLAFLTPGQVLPQEMLYRVAPSATAADLATAEAAITRNVPADAIDATQTYLSQAADVHRTAAIFVPILIAFSAFALLAAAFIIANVVSGIVLSSYRAIGLMKAIGYTPLQVTTSLVGEIAAPALIGALAGVTVGTIGSQPILAQTAQAFGLPAAFTLSGPVVSGVLAAAGLTVALAAIGPATRAGRLSAIGAITRGTAPSTHIGWPRLTAAVHQLPVPVPARLGLATGLAQPVRATMTLGALIVGVAALVFALGLSSSLRLVAGDLIRDQASPVRFELAGPAASTSVVTATLAANPATGRSVAIGQGSVTMAQLGQVPFVGYQGDASWLGYALISGRWFAQPGEAVAPTNFFTQTGLHVGSVVTIRGGAHSRPITLVGQIFDQARESRDDVVVRGEWADLAAMDPTIQPSSWEVHPVAGTDLQAYAASIRDAVGGTVGTEVVEDSSTNAGFLLFEGVISLLGTVLVAVSLAGVFNTVLLETRQRTRETAVLKAVGMTPRQVIASVLASTIPVGLLAGLIGVPIGLVVQRQVLELMGQAAASTAIPASALDVFAPPVLVALGLAGLAIGAVGALVPAQRAARARIASVLQAE